MALCQAARVAKLGTELQSVLSQLGFNCTISLQLLCVA